MRIVFMGTPEFALESLKVLMGAHHEVVAVVTMPDKAVGRGRKIQVPLLKGFAQEHNLPVLQPERLKDPAFLEELQGYQADMFVVVAFRMLPSEVFTMPPKGTVNLHAALLPQYRGAAPINHALINGETETGTTVFLIDKDMDTGMIVSQDVQPIHAEDNFESLYNRLAVTGAQHLLRALDSVENGSCKPMAQVTDDIELKAAPKLFRDTCRIDWSQSAEKIHNLVRGLSPSPGAWTEVELKGKVTSFKIIRTEVSEKGCKHPGEVLVDKQSLCIGTGDVYLKVLSLQPEGKKVMDTIQYLNGLQDLEVLRGSTFY